MGLTLKDGISLDDGTYSIECTSQAIETSNTDGIKIVPKVIITDNTTDYITLDSSGITVNTGSLTLPSADSLTFADSSTIGNLDTVPPTIVQTLFDQNTTSFTVTFNPPSTQQTSLGFLSYSLPAVTSIDVSITDTDTEPNVEKTFTITDATDTGEVVRTLTSITFNCDPDIEFDDFDESDLSISSDTVSLTSTRRLKTGFHYTIVITLKNEAESGIVYTCLTDTGDPETFSLSTITVDQPLSPSISQHSGYSNSLASITNTSSFTVSITLDAATIESEIEYIDITITPTSTILSTTPSGSDSFTRTWSSNSSFNSGTEYTLTVGEITYSPNSNWSIGTVFEVNTGVKYTALQTIDNYSSDNTKIFTGIPNAISVSHPSWEGMMSDLNISTNTLYWHASTSESVNFSSSSYVLVCTNSTSSNTLCTLAEKYPGDMVTNTLNVSCSLNSGNETLSLDGTFNSATSSVDNFLAGSTIVDNDYYATYALTMNASYIANKTFESESICYTVQLTNAVKTWTTEYNSDTYSNTASTDDISTSLVYNIYSTGITESFNPSISGSHTFTIDNHPTIDQISGITTYVTSYFDGTFSFTIGSESLGNWIIANPAEYAVGTGSSGANLYDINGWTDLFSKPGNIYSTWEEMVTSIPLTLVSNITNVYSSIRLTSVNGESVTQTVQTLKIHYDALSHDWISTYEHSPNMYSNPIWRLELGSAMTQQNYITDDTFFIDREIPLTNGDSVTTGMIYDQSLNISTTNDLALFEGVFCNANYSNLKVDFTTATGGYDGPTTNVDYSSMTHEVRWGLFTWPNAYTASVSNIQYLEIIVEGCNENHADNYRLFVRDQAFTAYTINTNNEHSFTEDISDLHHNKWFSGKEDYASNAEGNGCKNGTVSIVSSSGKYTHTYTVYLVTVKGGVATKLYHRVTVALGIEATESTTFENINCKYVYFDGNEYDFNTD